MAQSPSAFAWEVCVEDPITGYSCCADPLASSQPCEITICQGNDVILSIGAVGAGNAITDAQFLLNPGGIILSGITVTFTPSASGQYFVYIQSLVANTGYTWFGNTLSAIINVLPNNVIADFTGTPLPPCIGDDVEFTSACTPFANYGVWNIDAGAIEQYDINPYSYQFNDFLPHELCLYSSIVYVTNGQQVECAADDYCETFTASDLFAEISYGIENCNQFNFTPMITCTSSTNTYDYLWEIDNLSTGANPDYQSTSLSPSFTLPAGNYTVTFTITQTGGGASVFTTSINLSATTPAAPILNPNPALLCTGPATVSVSGGGVGSNYVWQSSANISLTNFNGTNTSCTATLVTGASGTISVYYTDVNGCTSPTTTLIAYGCCDGETVNGQLLTFNNITITGFITWMNANGFSGYMTANSITNFPNKIAFNGVLTLDIDFSFFDCPQITFGPYAYLMVNSGKHLTIDNSILKACSDVMWNGIAMLHATDIVTITNESEIHDAIVGVLAWGTGQINCNSSYFYDNHTGISILSGNNNLSVYGTLFDKQTNLLSPHLGEKPYYGIQIGYSSNIEIGKTFPVAQNIFQNLNIGISNYQSSTRIHNCFFQEIWKNPSFAFSGKAIHSYNPSSHLLFEVGWNPAGVSSKNNFYNCWDGVFVKGNHQMKIQNNEFNYMYNQGIHVEDNKKSTMMILSDNIFKEPNKTGIVCLYNFGSNIEIARNEIALYITGVNMQPPYCGIICFDLTWGINNNILPQYEIFNNVIENPFYGILGCALNGPRIFENHITLPPQLSANLFTEESGIRLLYCRNAQVFYNVVDGKTHNVSGIDVPNWKFKVSGIDNQFSSYSNFYCDSVINCNWAFSSRGKCFPTYYVANGIEFDSVGLVLYDKGFIGQQGVNASGAGYCSTYDNRWNGFGGTYDNKAYTGTYGASNGQLSPFVLRTPSSQDILSPLPFLFYNASTILWYPEYCSGLTHDILKCNNSIFSHNTALETMERIAMDSLSESEEYISRIWNKENLFLLLTDNPSLADSSTILQSFFDTSSVSPFSIITALLDSIINSEDTLLREYYRSIISSLEPANAHESNLKTIAVIVNESFTSDEFLIDTSYQSVLHDIAFQCPMDGGPAVFIARGLYYYMTGDITFEFENNCIETTGYMREENNDEEKINFSVNPNLIGVERFVDVVSNADGEFLITDISGRKIFRQKINAGKQHLDLNKNLLPGIYFYQFNFNIGIENGKLIIAE